MDETTALLNLINAKLDLLLVKLGRGEERELAMSAEVDRIKASVERLTSVNQSAITLMTTLAGEIRARLGDQAALTQLADEIDTRASELAAAVQTNTPGAGGTAGGAGGGTAGT